MVVLVQLPPNTPPFSQPRTLDHLAFVIDADEFENIKSHLESKGIEVRSGKHPLFPSRTMYIDDPDGNEVELICPIITKGD